MAFRQIQVLVTLANEISQQLALTSLIITGICAMSAGLSMLIKMDWSLDNMVLIFIFISCTTNGFLFLSVCLSGMGLVYHSCKTTMRKAKRYDAVRSFNICRNKLSLKKFWKSCAVPRIKFGSCNFVEELTPLNTVNFAVNATVQFLLVKN